MKLLKFLVIIVVVVVGGAWMYGKSQPREHFATSTIVLVTPADQVWRVIRDLQGTPAWWSDMRSIERIAGSGRESWAQDMGPAGSVRMEVSRETPGRQLVTTILNDEQDDWGGTWTYDVVPTASGTEVTITEEGWVEAPLMRGLMKLRGKYRTIESYLRSLGAHFGESVSPRRG